jgi:hypothetical protein
MEGDSKRKVDDPRMMMTCGRSSKTFLNRYQAKDGSLTNRMMAMIRGLALIVAVGLMAAAGSGAITSQGEPVQSVHAAPAAERFGPESFYGNVVGGSVTSAADATKFVVERPKKVGLDIDPTQRETVICQLEGVTADQAALVTASQGTVPQAVASPGTGTPTQGLASGSAGTPGQVLYFYGTYDPGLNVFFVSKLGTDAQSIAVAAPVGSGDDDEDNDDDEKDNSDDEDNSGDDDDDDDDDDDEDDEDSDDDDDDEDEDDD